MDFSISSVLNQTYSCWELILVDDGSKDNSGQICDSYANNDERITVIHKQNGGPASARKEGISAAIGKYILNIDSDDMYHPTLLERLNCILNRDSVDIIAFSYSLIPADCKSLPDTCLGHIGTLIRGKELCDFKKKLLYDSSRYELNAGIVNFSCCCKAIKSELIKKHIKEIPDSVICGDDGCFTIPAISECQSFYELPENLYFYRLNEESITHTFRIDELERYDDLIHYLNKILISIDEKRLNYFKVYLAMVYLTNAAQSASNYFSFLQIVKERWHNSNFYEVISYTIPPNLSLRTRVKLMLVRHGLWLCFWCVVKK